MMCLFYGFWKAASVMDLLPRSLRVKQSVVMDV